jgi:GNAT superfamily N-acetyltransferase
VSSNIAVRFADTSSEEAMRADARLISTLMVQNYHESGIPEHLAPFDPIRCIQSIYDTIKSGLVILAFDGERLVGGLGCVEFAIWYSPATMLGERFFYIKPEYRSGPVMRAILRVARHWSREHGKAIQLTISNFHKERPARTGLERIGDVLSYFPRGSVFQIAPAEKAPG